MSTGAKGGGKSSGKPSGKSSGKSTGKPGSKDSSKQSSKVQQKGSAKAVKQQKDSYISSSSLISSCLVFILVGFLGGKAADVVAANPQLLMA